jgi:hypothetical protein
MCEDVLIESISCVTPLPWIALLREYLSGVHQPGGDSWIHWPGGFSVPSRWPDATCTGAGEGVGTADVWSSLSGMFSLPENMLLSAKASRSSSLLVHVW